MHDFLHAIQPAICFHPGGAFCKGDSTMETLRRIRADLDPNERDILAAAGVAHPMLEDGPLTDVLEVVEQIIGGFWEPMSADWCQMQALELMECLAASIMINDMETGVDYMPAEARPGIAKLATELLRRSRLLNALTRQEKWVLQRSRNDQADL